MNQYTQLIQASLSIAEYFRFFGPHCAQKCESAPNINIDLTDSKSIKHLGRRSASGPHAG
jgi:hypothetical protein